MTESALSCWLGPKAQLGTESRIPNAGETTRRGFLDPLLSWENRRREEPYGDSGAGVTNHRRSGVSPSHRRKAVAATRFQVLTDGRSFVVWETTEEAEETVAGLHRPRFHLVQSFPNRSEAEAFRHSVASLRDMSSR